MICLVKFALLLGLSTGQDISSTGEPGGIQAEALADLDRRLGSDLELAEKDDLRQQEDERPQRPPTPVLPIESRSADWIDLEWVELHVRVGIAIYSKQFYISPSPCFAIEGRAPIPWLSPSDNPDGDYFGVFAELDLAMIRRTIKPSVAKPSGAEIGLAVGVDYTIFRNTTWLLMVRAGILYATYGGVTDLHDGIGPVVGLTAGLAVSQSVTLTLSPEYVLGKQDSVIMGLLGVAFAF